MSPDIGLQTILLAEATISDIVVDRVFLDRAPQEHLKTTHVVVDTIDEDPLLMLDGSVRSLQFIDVDIDCKAATAADAVTLSLAVRDFIQDYSGALGDGLVCRKVLYQGITSDFEKPLDGTDTGRHVRTVNVQLQYEPTS